MTIWRFSDNSNPSYISLFEKARKINDGAMISVAAFTFLVTLLTGQCFILEYNDSTLVLIQDLRRSDMVDKS